MKIISGVSRLAVVGIIFILLPTITLAYCSRGISFDYKGAVDAEFKYLICLHNEQVESINNTASSITDLRQTDQHLLELLREQASVISFLESKITLLERRLDILDDR